MGVLAGFGPPPFFDLFEPCARLGRTFPLREEVALQLSRPRPRRVELRSRLPLPHLALSRSGLGLGQGLLGLRDLLACPSLDFGDLGPGLGLGLLGAVDGGRHLRSGPVSLRAGDLCPLLGLLGGRLSRLGQRLSLETPALGLRSPGLGMRHPASRLGLDLLANGLRLLQVGGLCQGRAQYQHLAFEAAERELELLVQGADAGLLGLAVIRSSPTPLAFPPVAKTVLIGAEELAPAT